MALKTTKFDVADYLENESDMAEYLSEALALEDPAYFQHALGAVARAKGMAAIARRSGLGRQSLYKALSENGNPEFSTVIKVLAALGIKITTAPMEERSGKTKHRRTRRAA
jgi:probable addiction module antidote protein